MLGAAAIVTAGFVTTVASQAAEQLLSGTITAASGEKMGGVTVSAKREGSTIATHVYTDEQGNYYFPPLEAGKYRVWAQALGYEAAKSEVDLAAAKKHDLALQSMTDQERRWRQLPAELMIASLPEETAQDAQMKKILGVCTSLKLRQLVDFPRVAGHRGFPWLGRD